MAILDLLLPEFDQEMVKTRLMLERVPSDQYAWRPHEKSNTLGGLANHVGTMVGWIPELMNNTSFDVAPVGAEPYRPPQASSTDELLANFDKALTEARAALATGTDTGFLQPWSLLVSGKPIFTMPRIACLRAMVLNHTIHHRAQLGVYLRLLNVPVPGMYGPSADDPRMG